MLATASRILIVDDSDLNRSMLSEILTGYEIIEAKNGEEAVAIIERQGSNISLILLDLIMPVMNGFDVLSYMNRKHWIDAIPVIIISAENSPSSIVLAYGQGITDYISRPFIATVVRQRSTNAIALYARQRDLSQKIAEQYYRNERYSQLMVYILSHIVEFRNSESSLHVLHISLLTNILLRTLVKISNKYKLSQDDISLISHTSSLHDIGKISVPDAILNKPGRLTPDEFEIMKEHTTNGASMLQNLPWGQQTPLVRYSYEICRWHHERWDGNGYPDGLRGDETPISAQIVSVADVYDALVSKRVYKPAFSHKRTLEMILAGECGQFNPLLIECLKLASAEIQKTLESTTNQNFFDDQSTYIQEKLLRNEDLPITARLIGQQHLEKQKLDFLINQSEKIFFEYTPIPSTLHFFHSDRNVLSLEERYSNPEENEKFIQKIGKTNLARFASRQRHASPENPIFNFKCKININNKIICKHARCLTQWNISDNPVLLNVFGQVTD